MKILNQKKALFLVIGISTVFLMIIGFLWYSSHYNRQDNKEKFVSSEKTKKKTEEVEETNIAEEIDEEDELADFITDFSSSFGHYYPLDDLSKISNQERIYHVLYKLKNNATPTTKDNIEKEIRKLFGSDDITFEDINCPDINCPSLKKQIPLYFYQDGEYVLNSEFSDINGYHLCSNPDATPFVVSIVTDGNQITAKYKILYSNICCSPCITDAYYKNASDSINRGTPLLQFDSKEIQMAMEEKRNLLEENFSKIEDLVPTTTFVLEKNEYGYLIKSVTVQ